MQDWLQAEREIMLGASEDKLEVLGLSGWRILPSTTERSPDGEHIAFDSPAKDN